MSKDIYRSQIRIGKEWALVRIDWRGEASLEIPGCGDNPPEWCDQDPAEDSDYCQYHGPNGGPDPDAAYDERFL